MARDPAFLFYPGDYLGGTIGMTLEEKGGYMELLILQFNKGAFTIEQANKLLNGAFERLWPVLIEKFVEAEGKFFNKRLEEEKQKRENFVAFAKESGSKGGKKRWEKDRVPNSDPNNHPNSQNIPCAIENENEDKNVIEVEVVGESLRGAKKKWNTNPAENETAYLVLTNHELAQCEEYIFRIKRQQLTPERINDFWEAFKIQQFTGGKFYESRSRCVQHFRDWLKLQNEDSIKKMQDGKNGKPGFIENATKFMQQ